jgi:hypothetical protein
MVAFAFSHLVALHKNDHKYIRECIVRHSICSINSAIRIITHIFILDMSSPKILISGSGIAGSSFAHFLLKAYPKANITIVERAPSLRLTGASVGTCLRSQQTSLLPFKAAI